MTAHFGLLAAPFLTGALGVVVKATLLLLAAAATAAALRRAPAAARHLVWSVSLGGVVALALITPAAPRTVLRIAAPSEPAAEPSSGSRAWMVEPPRAAPVIGQRSATGVKQRSVRAADARSANAARPMIDWIAPRLPAAAAVAWLVGCLAVLARCVLAHVAVARIVRASERLNETAWATLVRGVVAEVGLRRQPAVLVNHSLGGPMTSGVVRPVVILPRDALRWTDERRRVVLLHELAHVARLDYLAQLVAMVACALFWFHPGVWLAAARLRSEAEHAADDRVLGAGLPGVTYAAHLVALARHARGGFLPAAIAVSMLRPSHLERRVRAMLDTTRSRAGVTRRVQLMAAAVALGALVPVAGLEVERAAAHPVERSRPAAALPDRPPLLDSVFEKSIDAAPGERIAFELSTGGAITLRGWDERRVRLRARLGGADWRATRVELERVDGGVRLRSELAERGDWSSTAHEFDLWVPRRFDVEVESAGGGITIRDLSGRFAGQTGGGSIYIERASGRASLSTGGGDVRVADSDLSGRVSTGGGTVILSGVKGGLRGSSGSGPVIHSEAGAGDLTGVSVSSDRIVTPEGAGAVHISKAGGAITLGTVAGGGTVHTGGGRIVVERSGGTLDARTGGGDIELRRVEGSASATTGAGDVLISVTGANGRRRTVEVESGSGRVVIELPRDFDARLDLETAYTANFGRRPTIDSDLTLDRHETNEWESPNGGTPRKYVRARGRLGNGSGLVRVRTVNGDVVIRQTGR